MLLIITAGPTHLSIKTGNQQKRDKTDKGCYPCISLNNHNTVVEVNHQTGTNWMFYRVGCVAKQGDRINWGHPLLAAAPPKKVYYGNGAFPQVSLNDQNIVVEVHKGQLLDRCFVRVGIVDPSSAVIIWNPSTYFNVGLFPVVTLNNRNTLLSVFQDNVFTKHLNYRVGRVANGGQVDWLSKSKQKARVSNAMAFAVDMNDSGVVVLSYQTSLKVNYKVGKIDGDSISWSANLRKGMGFSPSISINNSNEVILIHQSLAQRYLVSSVGEAKWERSIRGIAWSSAEGASNQCYVKGLYPSVSLNNGGQVVEVHEPRMARNRNRLYYYTTELKHYAP